MGRIGHGEQGTAQKSGKEEAEAGQEEIRLGAFAF
jgi:hypothetical protein